jgi:hypothetical protein
MSDRLTIISRSGRVFEMVNYWQVLLVNPPLQKSRSLDRTWYEIAFCAKKLGKLHSIAQQNQQNLLRRGMGSLAIQTEDRLKQLHLTKDRISLDSMDRPTITLLLVSYPRSPNANPHSARSGKYAAVVRAFIEKKSIAVSLPKECCLDRPIRKLNQWFHLRWITLIPVGAGSPIIFAKNRQSQKPAPAIVLWAIDRTWYDFSNRAIAISKVQSSTHQQQETGFFTVSGAVTKYSLSQ